MPARSLDQIVSLSKRRGFVFPGSAAYGGLGSFWDYGPLGAELMRNVKDAWWKSMTHERDDVEGVDCAILMNRKVWQHSGHEATFGDILLENRANHKRYRLDHLIASQPDRVVSRLLRTASQNWDMSNSNGLDAACESEVDHGGHGYSYGVGSIEKLATTIENSDGNIYGRRLGDLIADFLYKNTVSGAILADAGLIDPMSGKVGEWTVPRRFLGMLVSHLGPVEAAPGTEEELSSRVYLRPETAQGIFMNFSHVQESMRRKLPFGIAQIGKAFRNEITPGNFTFRTREFEQMELEFFIKPPQFVKPDEKNDDQWHADWVEQRYRWWITLGIDMSRLRKRAQDKAELAHYAKATTDLEYLFPGSLGWGEVEGIANRTDYDLSAHSREIPEADLKRLKLEKNADAVTTFDYFDSELKQRYVPWVIEPSAGATRAALTFLCEAYHEEMVKEPPAAEIEALKTEIDATIKNADKKKKDAEKEADPTKRKHEPLAITQFQAALAEAATRLPASLMEIDYMLADHPGAANLEPVKKLAPKVSKLAEDCVRVVLRLDPRLAPIKVAVFPLAKNKPELVQEAQMLASSIRKYAKTIYEDSAGIGKLYRRQDEIGTPLCITVDHATLEDHAVTIRDRDTMQQVRVPLEKIHHEIRRRLHMH